MKKLKIFYGFYDFANSAYGIVLQNYLLPTYFSVVLINHWLTLGSWWLANWISTVLGVVIWILAWRSADRKWDFIKPFLGLVASAFLFSLMLWYAIYADPKYVFWIYMVANWFYIWSISVYNWLLSQLVNKKDSHEFSWFAWGFGYLWWIIWLIVIMLLQKIFWTYNPLIFIFISVFYMIFSLISVIWIKNSKIEIKKRERQEKPITSKTKLKLLFWYWLISECITVILLFFGTYVTGELKLSLTIAWVCMLLVQLIGLPATIYWSRLFNKLWERKSMNIMVVIWVIAIISLIIGIWYAWLIITLILWWLVVWNTQSLMRSEYSNLIDSSKSWFEFGIFGFITQIWSFIWPIIYWYMSDWLWSQKIPLLIFGIFMVIWLIFINKSPVPQMKHGLIYGIDQKWD
ncbi:MAG: hypothetical protein ACD_2C00091G0011 [uncultured bacterium (gcode 4)]|uniref:MFS transporter n=1 Tax=uncultured bacterium (gcode 4) TaxID=1234023 RepID=K2H1V2_9BACT|nr:MAG: hypothetical protein ACD_2C00091G0011 [uncultured bacterium (gcode 4)]